MLSVLRDEELYGYEIAQRIRDRSGEMFAPSEGSLYPTLHRPERGCPGSHVAGERARAAPSLYAITPAGQGLFADASREWDAVSAGITRMARATADA